MSEAEMKDMEDEILEEDLEEGYPVEDVTDGAPMNCVENELEWLRGQKVIAGTLCRGKFANRIRKYAKERPDEVQILADNEDGSIFFHMPAKYLHIYPPHARELTEEQKAASKERLAKARENMKKG